MRITALLFALLLLAAFICTGGCMSEIHAKRTELDVATGKPIRQEEAWYRRTGFDLKLDGAVIDKKDNSLHAEVRGVDAQYQGWEAMGKAADALKAMAEKAVLP